MNYCLFASKQGLLFESHALFEGVNIIGMGVNIVRIRNGCIEDMMQLDWDYPQRESEQHFFFMDMFKKFALHKLGYISLDYDNALYKVVTLFAEWDRCSEGVARIKVECKIKAIEDTLTKVI